MKNNNLHWSRDKLDKSSLLLEMIFAVRFS